MKYVCAKCGFETPRWMGKCSECGEWGSLEEVEIESGKGDKAFARKRGNRAKPLKTRQLKSRSRSKEKSRVAIGVEEFDRVLGGGMIPGSTLIISGDPGIGKSTLLTAAAISLARSGKKVIYFSGEESGDQVTGRFKRILGGKIPQKLAKNLSVSSSNNVDAIISTIEENSPSAAIIDSIQAVGTSDLASFWGSLSQVRESTMRLSEAARSTGVSLVITAQVTKAGEIAGPKILEHIVDVVLYLEGDKFGRYRVLRGLKNRFGSTREIGVFEMTEKGMEPVQNASAAFLSERKEDVSGVVTVCTMEGSRPILVEVQALTSPTQFNLPKRVANGVNRNRVELICAILSRRARLNLADTDVYVNVVGGVKLTEPGADLGIALAIASAQRDKPIDGRMVVVGEVGLTGEIVQVPFLKERKKEGKRLGYSRFVGPGDARNLREVVRKVVLGEKQKD